MAYAHSTLWINNRIVTIEAILQSTVVENSPFEKSTFNFIREWLSQASMFSQFTSGSTGAPKEIILTRKQLEASARRTLDALSIHVNHTALVCLDTYYIAGKMMIARALEGNLKIAAIEPSANPLKSIPQDLTIDFAALVPLQLQEMLYDAQNNARLNAIKKIIVGGALVPDLIQKTLQPLSSEVYATYGMTETVSHIALQRLNGSARTEYFKVLPGIQIEKDDRGCLVVRLPEFDEKIITNDLVELIDANHFIWRGRWDTLINTGGFKVSPEKVEREAEKVFQRLMLTNKLFVSSIHDDKLGQKLVLVIEGSPLGPDLECDLKDQLRTTLHPYEIPREIQYIPKFILTDTGKINRLKSLNR